jgi:tRNA G18 (ribose-2'-O)-methylase SpoU
VAEGEKVVRRLIESRLAVESVMLPEKWLPEFERLLAPRTEDIRVFVGAKELLEQLTGFTMYQGVLAVGRVPAQPSLETLLQTSPRPVLLLAADQLANAQNMGVLVRNCATFGAHALLVGETCCSPFLRRSVRASMGAVFSLPVLEVATLAETLARLRAGRIRCIAAHPHTDGRTVSRADFTRDCCIVLGSEGHGLSSKVLAACDEAAAIPMPPEVDSLNVGSASAMFLYEAAQQRGRMG